MLLGLAWPWMSVRGLSGSLGFDRPRCREGEPVAARITVRNRMPWGVWGVSIKGGIPPAGTRTAAKTGPCPAWPSSPAGGRSRRASSSSPTAGGSIPKVRRAWPAGSPSACGSRRGRWMSRRRCWSGRAPSPSGRCPRRRGAILPTGWRRATGRATGATRSGCDPTAAAIRSAACTGACRPRHGELIVREVQSSAVPSVQIVLDSHAAAHDDSGPDGSLEWAIRVAASLAEGWIGQGAEVELVLEGTSILPRGGSARTRSRAVLDALARFRPARRSRPRGPARAIAEGRPREGGLRVVITTDVGLRGSTGDNRGGRESATSCSKAGAFGADADGSPAAPLPVVPWILIDGPGRVATCLRRATKEVLLGH